MEYKDKLQFLKELVKVAKENQINQLTIDGISFSMKHSPSYQTLDVGVEDKVKIEDKLKTEEDLLFWSSEV